MYVIVIGAGDIATPLIDVATRAGNEVVVEHEEAKANEVASEYDCLVLNADATTKDTLTDAGAGRADAPVSTTEHDATNVMVCLLAQEFEIPAVLSVVHNPEHMNLFRQIGVNTMENPQQLIAEHLYRSVARPAVVDFMRIGDDAVERNGDGEPITPTGDTRIEAGDLLTVYSGDGADPEITGLFGHYEDRVIQ